MAALIVILIKLINIWNNYQKQQRVAIVRALTMQSPIIMVREILNIIRSLADSGMTMVCVIHKISFAREVADRVVFIG